MEYVLFVLWDMIMCRGLGTLNVVLRFLFQEFSMRYFLLYFFLYRQFLHTILIVSRNL